MERFDVVVVGAGPAGSSAAWAAASRGASVLLLDRVEHPRYKTCGGGLIGPSLAELDRRPGTPPVRTTVRRASFTLRGGREAVRDAGERVIRCVVRPELDAWLLDAAVAAGAEVRTPVAVRSVEPGGSGSGSGSDADAVVRTASGDVAARVVIAADGTSGRASKAVGVRLAQVDLGLELEVDAAGSGFDQESIQIDWGPIPGSYGWVFPKGDTLTVGVIARRGRPEETRAYLRAYLEQRGLAGQRVVHESGHLTRCRTSDSPLAAGRVLAVGDAAGLLEPWTREGISFALRSGRLAGEVAAAGLASSDGELRAAHADALGADLLPEMAAGFRCLRAFERRPGAFHALIAHTRPGWEGFRRLASGETTLDRALAHRSVRVGLGVLGASVSPGARGNRSPAGEASPAGD
ncbi:geranylgeranyl reductase family protein [Nocardioides sp. TRM66260-LWL]|uniref:geranylgeranyl reductase family protein n=1 Tax=Nocardioides sp. TRM66260-LWL TaxID=2874478 RepID=UPI0027DEDADC|nr:geranylgeranyl reductase family protein [Nocardioides sp. TRM66260-LWL]